MRWLWLAVVFCGCAHAPPRATVFGKKVALGEVVADRESTAALKDALADAFELDATNPELHLHVEAGTSGHDEPVIATQGPSLEASRSSPRVVRRVQTMRVTLRLVEDATGEVRALGIYELMEKGPERPVGARESDELIVILARRAVRQFIEENKL